MRPAVRFCIRSSPVLAAAALLAASGAVGQQAASRGPRLDAAVFSASGELAWPADTDRWVVLGTSLGSDYAEGAFDPANPGTIGVVQIEQAIHGAQAGDGLAQRLEQVSLTFSARVGEEGKLFGSVTASDIAHQLEGQGFQIEKRQIDLHEPLKTLGVFRVPVRLHADVKPEIKVWVIKQ